MKRPKMLGLDKDMTLAVADYYEYSMAHANMIEDITGKETVFDTVVRNPPKNKVTGYFEHEGERYEKLERRDYLINAGLEQVAAYLLEARGNERVRDYMADIQSIDDEGFLEWVENIRFRGDLYAMREGEIFFGQEQQLRMHERFEEAQVFESLILNTINPQTNVATTANDIAEVATKVLLEGGSRRAGSPQGAIFNTRAARIGGFHATSNVAYGMLHDEKVGGTHGHSYVMLHPDEYTAFRAQVDTFRDGVVFLLDTYNIREAYDTAMNIVKEEGLKHFGFRIDSGDLLEQALWLHKELQEAGFGRQDYTLIASDDLTAAKVDRLEQEGADVDKYLIGTYVVNPPRPVGGVFKLAAYKAEDGWRMKGKLSENMDKATLPGIKQIYRIQGEDEYYKKDIIAFEDENITDSMDKGDTYRPLLVPIIRQGQQVYDFPVVQEISDYRKQELAKFRDIANYEVIVSEKVKQVQKEIVKEHGVNRYAA